MDFGRPCITAKRLPKDLVKNVIGKMKGNIEDVVASEGGVTNLD